MPKSATFKRSTLFINMHAPIRLAQATFFLEYRSIAEQGTFPSSLTITAHRFTVLSSFDVVEVLYNKPSELHNATARSPANTLRKPNYGYDVIYSFLQPPAGVSQLA